MWWCFLQQGMILWRVKARASCSESLHIQRVDRVQVSVSENEALMSARWCRLDIARGRWLRFSESAAGRRLLALLGTKERMNQGLDKIQQLFRQLRNSLTPEDRRAL